MEIKLKGTNNQSIASRNRRTAKVISWLLMIALICITLTVVTVSADGNIHTFTPSDDAYIHGGSSNQASNFGGLEKLVLKRASSAGNYRKSFLKFDLSSLGNTFDIAKATLTLNGYAEVTPFEVGIYQLDDNTWTEGTITWTTAPEMAFETSTQIGTLTVENTNSSNYKAFTADLTEHIFKQVDAGNYIISLGMDSITFDKTCNFYSKEKVGYEPKLVVECVPGGPKVTKIAPENGKKLFVNSPAYIDFNSDMDENSVIDKNNVVVASVDGGDTVEYSLSYNSELRRCTIDFMGGLTAGESYTISLKSDAIKSVDQKTMSSDRVFEFTATDEPWDAGTMIIGHTLGAASADVLLTNNKSDPADAVIFIGLYEKDAENKERELLAIACRPYVIEGGSAVDVKTPVLTIPSEIENYILRGFLWEDVVNAKPITDPVEAESFQGLDAIRDKMRTLLTGGSTYGLIDQNIINNITEVTENAQQIWDSMNKGVDRANLWSTFPLGSKSSNITSTYANLKAMAIAYSIVGADLYRNKAMLRDIISGLDWMSENIYNPTQTKYDNWWDWEMGAPIALNDIVILIYNDLSEEQCNRYMEAVAHFQPSITQTGANRVWECKVFLGRGVILKNSDLISEACAGLDEVLVTATSGDGFYDDGSFIQHSAVPYNGGYGKSLLHDISDLLYSVEGSVWEIDAASKEVVYGWIYDSFRPFIYKGAFMDMVRGREISRSNAETHQVGHSVISDILRLSQIAPEEHSKAFQSMAKYWIEENTTKSFFESAANDIIMQATSILNDPSIESRGELIGYRQFYNMDRAVQIRPGYGVGVSMHSTRIFNYEMMNEENIKGYHTSDGALFLYNSDLLQYSDDFWPTVDKYRIPGTTVLAGTNVSANVRSDRSWVGGVQMGDFGISGMDLHTYGRTLEAKKSWFMFDNEIVALGMGINSSDDIVVETIIENRKINGDNQFFVDDEEMPANLGWSESTEGTDWIYLEGNVEDADIGYFFPSGANVNMLREARSGSWADMRKAESSTSMTANYLTMWFDHEKNPENKSYAYVILPNMTKEQTKLYAQSPNIVILENSDDLQAVKETTQNIVGVNFWKDISRTIDKITCDKKASVMIKQTSEELEISVSDPTQLNTGDIQIEINQSAERIISADDNITIEQLTPTIKISVNVKGSKGKSYSAKFSLDHLQNL